MAVGYTTFEFNLPEALLSQLIIVLDELEIAPLTLSGIAGVPETQGVYQLFLVKDGRPNLVYIGKTDSDSGLANRLSRHSRKILHRNNLSPADVVFKAVRVFVFTAVDLEAQLLKHYRRSSKVLWNNSGFGSNDPGFERDTSTYKGDHFDTLYPIDLTKTLDFHVPSGGSAITALEALKSGVPYVIRYQTQPNSRRAHADLEQTQVFIDPHLPTNSESIIAQIIKQLPVGWHATVLPSHVIIYKNDARKFPHGRTIALS